MRRILACTAAGLLAAACLAASCRATEPRPLVLAVGGAPAELSFWEELAREFGGEHGLRVELLRQPSDTDQRRQSLVIALSARQADPDVFLMDVAWIGLFSAAGWLQPLDASIDPAPFFPEIVKRADTHRGKLVALPVYVDAGILYYRKDLLAEFGHPAPPDTWEALRRIAEDVQHRMRERRPGFYGFVWQGAQYEGLTCNFLEFAGTAGGLIVADGRVRIDTPGNRSALEFMHALIWNSRVSPPSTYTEMQEEETRALFQSGAALFERNWPYAWALHQQPGSPVRGKVAVCPLPAPAGAGAVATLGGWHVGISAFSDRKQEASALVRFITSRSTQKRLALSLGWNPGREDLYEDAEIRERAPHLSALAAAFRRAVPRPALPFYPQLSGVVQRHLNSALAGRQGAREALSAAQADIDRLVERYGAAPSGGG
jgi:multiple sugar transport system substrate-binding protein